MTLLSVVKDVCAVTGVTIPVSVLSGIATNRTMTEMLALANEMAQRIAYDNRDWTKLKKTVVFTGDGHFVPPQPDPAAVWTGTTAFNLPADFQRMLLSSSVWRSTSAIQPMTFIPDTNEWIQRRALNWVSPWGEWTIIGGQMLIFPIMAGPIVGPPAVPAVTATFAYIHKNCVTLASGGAGDAFQADGDAFVLGDRLLKLGMIWQWKAQKGSAYAEDMGTYGDALTYAMGHDSPAPIIIGSRPMSSSLRAGVAYPWPVPT